MITAGALCIFTPHRINVFCQTRRRRIAPPNDGEVVIVGHVGIAGDRRRVIRIAADENVRCAPGARQFSPPLDNDLLGAGLPGDTWAPAVIRGYRRIGMSGVIRATRNIFFAGTESIAAAIETDFWCNRWCRFRPRRDGRTHTYPC